MGLQVPVLPLNRKTLGYCSMARLTEGSISMAEYWWLAKTTCSS